MGSGCAGSVAVSRKRINVNTIPFSAYYISFGVKSDNVHEGI